MGGMGEGYQIHLLVVNFVSRILINPDEGGTVRFYSPYHLIVMLSITLQVQEIKTKAA